MWGSVLVALLVAGFAPNAHAAVTQRTALIYGDSLIWESYKPIANAITAKPGWSVVNHSKPGTAPCDWLTRLDADLATYHPATVTLATAGNTGLTACMTAPMGSPEYYDGYRADLDTFFAKVTTAGAKMVFVADPPFVNPDRDAAQIQIITIATELAANYHGVSIAKTARTQLSKGGKYVAYKPCLKTETADQGCSDGKIAIRTISGVQAGLHLCPPGLPPDFPWFCEVYSSGELRFGTAVGKVAVHPPKPVAQ